MAVEPEATPAQQNRALSQLLSAVDSLITDFSADIDAVLRPVIEDALEESGQNQWLGEVLRSFGWQDGGFSGPVDVRALSSRLRALVYEGLTVKGTGSFAVVYKARDRLTGEVITLKKLKMDREEEGVPGNAIREIALLKELHHPNIVRLRDVLWDHTRLYLIMDYVDLDLREHMDTDPDSSSLENVKSYVWQILKAMQFCHARRVLHRDLKPQNILIDRASNSVKVADFGLARCFTPPIRPYTHEVVTLLYRAPEILLGGQLYSTPVDIWSIGCIFAELLNGRPLFMGDSEIGQLYKIFEVLGTPSDAVWAGVSAMPDWQARFPQWQRQDLATVVPRLDPLGLDLLRQMLEYDPARRITARRALQHPYFGELREAEALARGGPAEGGEARTRSASPADSVPSRAGTPVTPSGLASVAEAGARNADLELAALAEVLPTPEQRGGGISVCGRPPNQQQKQQAAVAGDSAYVGPDASATGGAAASKKGGSGWGTPCGSPIVDKGNGVAHPREPLAQLGQATSPTLIKRPGAPLNAEPAA